jgi:hypothetical protein
MKRAFILSALFLSVFLAVGFDCGGSIPPPPVGFQVHTMDEQDIFGTLQDSPNINLTFYLEHLAPGQVQGFITSFHNVVTDSNGLYSAVNGQTPAVWNFTENNGPCGAQSVPALISNNQTQPLDCINLNLAFSMTPSTLDTFNPPTTFQVYGSGISGTHGMPKIQLYDNSGDLLAQITASSVAGNGSSLNAVMPDVSTFHTATYGVRVMNVQQDGSLEPAGVLPLDIEGNEARGLVSISGSERGCIHYQVSNNPLQYAWIPDVGKVSVTVNGKTSTATYSGSCDQNGNLTYQTTAANIASSLASSINSSSAGVTATAGGGIISLSLNAGSYVRTLTASSQTTESQYGFSGTSFPVSVTAP